MKTLTIAALVAALVPGGAMARASGAAAAKPAAPASSAATDVAALVESSCTGCHAATQYSAHRKTAAQWRETVEQMVDYGAVIADDQYDRIVAYLAATYGPDAKP